MSDTQRLKPAAKYRVVYKIGNFFAIDYADDRAEAVEYAKKVGGKVECHIWQIGWQPIEKVDP